MKASLVITYPLRSLFRGGLRTTLAIFCITVGVLSVVSLQLVSAMMQDSLSTSARAANGGDIAVTAQGAPFQTSDLAFFENLKSTHTITSYTAVSQVTGNLSNASTITQSFNLEAIDPASFPLVQPPTFITPANGSMAQILANRQVVVTQNFLSTYHKQLGESFPVYVKTTVGAGQTLNVTIGGVIANSGTFIQSGNLLLMSTQDYLATAPATLHSYTLVDMTTADQAQTTTAVKAIQHQFQLVNIQTASDLLSSEQSSIDLLSNFLKIAGLLALLISGAGIVNTMQVLLSRRKKEIAMLKTAGYQRTDLALLFGLETGLLGLSGGILGAAAAIGVSSLIRNLVLALGTNLPFTLHPGIILGGVLIGFFTALIFGLLPIVQAANIRPLQILREFEKKSLGGYLISICLLALASLLFCVLATVILNNNLGLGIAITYSTCLALIVLGLLFSLLVVGISKLPVPDGWNFQHVLLIVSGLAFSIYILRLVPTFGILLLLISLMGVLVVFLPGSAKINIRMALRNIGRQRTRTTATLLALFIGVLGIGMDVGVGQDLGNLITSALNQNSPYNIVATTAGQDATTLQANLKSISGLTSSRTDPFTETLPLAINGQPAQQLLPTGSFGQQVRNNLGGLEGYNLAQSLPAQKIVSGRNLQASDSNTNNVLVSQVMTSQGWDGLKLKVGDTVTLGSLDGKTRQTVTIVGIISVPTSFETLGEVLASQTLVQRLSPTTGQTSVSYLKVVPAQLDQALARLNHIVPNASVQNLSDAATSFLQQVASFLDVVLAVAALSLFAGIVIIANSVALAMLERRRELGILKSVGYTSRTILTQVLIEYGIIGGIGALVATLLASVGVASSSKYYFSGNLTLNMEPSIILLMVIGPVVLAIITAILIAWNAVRVRPLEVLRYE